MLAPLRGSDVQVGDVQQPDRCRTGREHRHVEAAQRERVALDQPAVRQAAAPAAARVAAAVRTQSRHAHEGYAGWHGSRSGHARAEGPPAGRPQHRDEGARRADHRDAAHGAHRRSPPRRSPARRRASSSDDEVLRVTRPGGEEAARGRRGLRRGGTRRSWPRASGPRARCSTATCPPSSTTTSCADLVRAAIAEAGATAPRQMGAVMKIVQPRVAGRADGKRVSDEVRRQLGRLTPRLVTRPPSGSGSGRPGAAGRAGRAGRAVAST